MFEKPVFPWIFPWSRIGALSLVLFMTVPAFAEDLPAAAQNELNQAAVSPENKNEAPVVEASKMPLSSNPPVAIADTKKTQHVTGHLQKRELAVSEMLPAIQDIFKLKWTVAPEQAQGEVRKITLDKVFKETLEHNIDVRQAQAQIKLAEAQGKEMREPSLLTFFNPITLATLKNAAEDNVRAAEWHVMAVQQKALLDSAKLHADLVQSFLNKYLAFQAIEQGCGQLKAEQQRFIAGDTTSFDVGQTQVALLERYGKYLAADNLYHTASLALSNQLSSSVKEVLMPEDYMLQNGNVSVTPLNLIPTDFSLEKAFKATQSRPEIQELNYKKETLQGLIKSTFGVEKDKHEAEMRQFELLIEKANAASLSTTEKAYADFKLAEQALQLAQQRYTLATQFVHQLQISHDAGFSSSKEVLDGQIDAERSKAGLISAQVAHNLSQIKLVYEMGQLNGELLTRGISTQNL